MNHKRMLTLCLFVLMILLCGCQGMFGDLSGTSGAGNSEQTKSGKPLFSYHLLGYRVVSGRQGTAYDGGFYYVSGTNSLRKYDKDFNIVAENNHPFESINMPVNHLGDIDIHDGKIFAGIEWFEGGKAKSPAIAVFDAESLKLRQLYALDEKSGQREISGVTYDPERGILWSVSWEPGESSAYLYGYSLENGAYISKIKMTQPPYHCQGIKYHDGVFYLTADDGDAAKNEPDHLYRGQISDDQNEAVINLEKSFDEFAAFGEIEGLTFDGQGRLCVIHNRGYHVSYGIIDGYDRGYDTEISEMYCYEVK